MLFCFLSVACEKGKNALWGNKVIAKVDGAEITGRDLIRYYDSIVQPQKSNGGQSESVSLELKKSLLERLIEEKLLLRVAAKEGIQVNDEEVSKLYEGIAKDYGKDFNNYLKRLGVKPAEWRASLRRDLLIERVINRHLQRVENPTDQEIKKYYHEHLREFQVPMQYRFSQIVVPTLKAAQRVQEKLKAGEDFSKLAKQYSVFPEGKRGGDLGYWREDRLPEEFALVHHMKVGEVSDIIHTPYGYGLILLTDVRDARVLSLKEAGPRIARRLLQEKRGAEKARWVKGLKKKALIVRDENVLKEMAFN